MGSRRDLRSEGDLLDLTGDTLGLFVGEDDDISGTEGEEDFIRWSSKLRPDLLRLFFGRVLRLSRRGDADFSILQYLSLQ